MPLYEYECSTCGRRTEVIQRVGGAPIGPCAECGGEMRKLISVPAFQFKGSGWYVTDYARKGAGGTGDSGKSTAESAGDKEASKDSSASSKDSSVSSKGSSTSKPTESG